MQTKQLRDITRAHAFTFTMLLGVLLASCSAVDSLASGGSLSSPDEAQAESTLPGACPATEPLLVTPPEDPAVQNKPEPEYYYVNEDRSIWASAWWRIEEQDTHWRAGEEGVKVGWFRPEGADLEITGQRIDAQAAPLEAHIPCCYPTRFQVTGLIFPTEGCWEITARAADSLLSFVVWVDP